MQQLVTVRCSGQASWMHACKDDLGMYRLTNHVPMAGLACSSWALVKAGSELQGKVAGRQAGRQAGMCLHACMHAAAMMAMPVG